MVNGDFINEVTKALLPGKTNNLAARISVMNSMIERSPEKILTFREEQVYGVRKYANELKEYIDEETFNNVQKICDYFEATLIACKISKE